jgi:hypothetical protein
MKYTSKSTERMAVNVISWWLNKRNELEIKYDVQSIMEKFSEIPMGAVQQKLFDRMTT